MRVQPPAWAAAHETPLTELGRARAFGPRPPAIAWMAARSNGRCAAVVLATASLQLRRRSTPTTAASGSTRALARAAPEIYCARNKERTREKGKKEDPASIPQGSTTPNLKFSSQILTQRRKKEEERKYKEEGRNRRESPIFLH